MELIVHRDNGMFTIHILSDHKETVYPLIPDTGSIYLLVKAIQSTYPTQSVLIDPTISQNPFMRKSLFVSRHYRISPDYIRVQYSLENPEIKECGICGREAWYNCYRNDSPFVGWWECTNCHAQLFNKEWIKMSRNAKR